MRLIFVAVLILAPIAAAAGTCAPSCSVIGNYSGFVPPVTVLASGAQLAWTQVDPVAPSHTATADDGSSCFSASFHVGLDGTATFRIANGQLLAKAGLTEKPCAGATALPDGSFVVPYICLYHQQMVGQLVIVPGGIP